MSIKRLNVGKRLSEIVVHGNTVYLAGEVPDDATLDITGRIPIGRFATPDDVAHAILFLADGTQSAFINGAALTVDGGWTADGGWESLRRSHRS